MANLCNNTLTFIGKNKDLVGIKKKAKNKEELFDMKNFVPIPEDAKDYKSPQGEFYNGIGGWAIEHWGALNPYDVEIHPDIEERNNAINFIKDDNWLDQDGLLGYRFTTNWSPLVEGVIAISSQYPDVHITYYYSEQGNGIHCYKEFKAGLETRHLNLPLDEYDEKTEEFDDHQEEIDNLINSDKGYY